MTYFTFDCAREKHNELLSQIPYEVDTCVFTFDGLKWYGIANGSSNFSQLLTVCNTFGIEVYEIPKEDIVALDPTKTDVQPHPISGNEDLLPWPDYI